jgi:hypothetical protein
VAECGAEVDSDVDAVVLEGAGAVPVGGHPLEVPVEEVAEAHRGLRIDRGPRVVVDGGGESRPGPLGISKRAPEALGALPVAAVGCAASADDELVDAALHLVDPGRHPPALRGHRPLQDSWVILGLRLGRPGRSVTVTP